MNVGLRILREVFGALFRGNPEAGKEGLVEFGSTPSTTLALS
jgi:hypothetical protein